MYCYTKSQSNWKLKCHYPRVSPGDLPLTKSRRNSGLEIGEGKSEELGKEVFYFSCSRLWCVNATVASFRLDSRQQKWKLFRHINNKLLTRYKVLKKFSYPGLVTLILRESEVTRSRSLLYGLTKYGV